MTEAEQSLLERFPKARRPLPPAFQAIYESHYVENRKGATRATWLSSRLEQWMHRRVASAEPRRPGPWRLLEIGAGNLNHFRYEKNVQSYDVVEPMGSLYASAPERFDVDDIHSSLDDVSPDARYDKIFSIAVLEHVCELPELVAGSALRLEKDGVYCAGIPSEGTILWRLGWKATTGREFRRRHGLDYATLMEYEHVNTAAEILDVMRVFFDEVRAAAFGVSRGLSLYQAIEARGPRVDACRKYLRRP